MQSLKFVVLVACAVTLAVGCADVEEEHNEAAEAQENDDATDDDNATEETDEESTDENIKTSQQNLIFTGTVTATPNPGTTATNPCATGTGLYTVGFNCSTNPWGF